MKVISITSAKASEAQVGQVREFLGTFLPRLRKSPGVNAIYQFPGSGSGEETTIIVWESESALRAYRESALMQEVTAFAQEHGFTITRETHPLTLAL
jgi:quinol monooxygenase YgiN